MQFLRMPLQVIVLFPVLRVYVNFKCIVEPAIFFFGKKIGTLFHYKFLTITDRILCYKVETKDKEITFLCKFCGNPEMLHAVYEDFLCLLLTCRKTFSHESDVNIH
jgi:hypothetical protein